MESKVYHIIHDNGFKRNCLVIPRKYYGDYSPITCPFDYPYKTPITVKVQCQKCIRKGIKQRIEWQSRLIIETGGGDFSTDSTRRFQFIQNIGNTENIGKFRIGLLLFAPDPECNYTWLYKCKATIEHQELNQLSNVSFDHQHRRSSIKKQKST